MKYLFLLLFVFGVFGGVLGQNDNKILDSLESIYKDKKIMHQEIYNRIAYEIAGQGRVEESIALLNSVISKTKDKKALEELASLYKTLGQIHSLYLSDFDKALLYYNQSFQLVSQMKEGTDKELLKAVIYTTSSRSLEALGKIDSSFVLLNKALELRKKYGVDKKKELQIHSYLITNMARRSKYQEALDYSNTVILNYTTVDTLDIISIFLTKRILHSDLGQYDSSVIMLEKADALLNLYTTTDPIQIRSKQHNLVNIAMQRGTLMGRMDRHEEALNHFRNALKLSIQYNKSLDVIAVMYENIAMANLLLGNIPSAIDTAKLALTNYRIMNLGEHIATQTGVIGVLYDSLGKYDSAVVYIKESISLLEKMNYPDKLLTSLQTLSSCYMDMGNYKESLKYALLAEQKAKEIGTSEVLWKTYYILAQSYEKNGNDKKALENYRLYVSYRDKDFSSEQKQKVDSLQTLYQVAEKDRQIEEEKLLNQLNQEQLTTSTTISVATGIVSFLLISTIGTIFFLFRQRAKRKQVELELKNQESINKQNELEVKSQKEEREKIKLLLEKEKVTSQLQQTQLDMENQINLERQEVMQKSYKEMSHFVHNISAGGINTMIMELNTLEISDIETKQKFIEQLKTLREKYRNITRLIEQLSNKSLDHQIQSYRKLLMRNHPLIYFGYEVIELPQLTTDITGQKAQDLFLFIQETINNSIKHSNANHINIIVSSTEENELKIEIIDDGEGFDVENTQSSGLEIWRNKVKDLNGELTINSIEGQGTTVSLLLPATEEGISDKE